MKSPLGTLVRAATGRTQAPDTPVRFARDGIYQGQLFGSGRDRDTLMRTVESNGTLFSIVNRTSTAVAALNWRLYRKTPQRHVTTERVEVQSHAVLDLLDRPNRFMSGPLMWETVQQHVDLCGEGYLLKARAKGFSLPLELWPVPPNRIEPVPSSTKFLAGWLYTGPDGEQVPLDLNDVIQFKMPHPRDPYRGLGPVQAMLTVLDAYKYSVEWNRNFFVNSAQPGGIIQLDRRMEDNDWNQFVNRWNEQHRGVQRAHRVAVIEEAQWVTNQLSMADMQFAELHTLSRDDLFVAFGISGSVMGVTEDVNRANAEAGKAMFAELLTEPRGARIRGQLNAQLLPDYGPGSEKLELDFDSPVPADVELDNASRTSKTTGASVLVAAGWDPDDVLDAMELPPMKYVGAPAVVAAQAQQAAAEAQQAAQQAQGGDDDADGQDDGDEPDADEPDTPKPGPGNRLRNDSTGQDPNQPQPAQTNPDLTAVDEQWKAAIAALLALYLADIVPAQRAELLDQIRAHVAAGQTAKLGSLTVDTEAAQQLLMRAMTDHSAASAQQATTEAMRQGISIDPVPATEKALEPIATVTADLLGRDLATTAGVAALRAAAPGASPEQVVQTVREALAETPTSNVEAQLGGVLSAAQNKARIATFTAPGNPRAELVATEVLDKNTCEPCSEEDGHSFGFTDNPDTVLNAHMEYPTGGYVGCKGWMRCRGTVHAVYTDPIVPTGGA